IGQAGFFDSIALGNHADDVPLVEGRHERQGARAPDGQRQLLTWEEDPTAEGDDGEGLIGQRRTADECLHGVSCAEPRKRKVARDVVNALDNGDSRHILSAIWRVWWGTTAANSGRSDDALVARRH